MLRDNVADVTGDSPIHKCDPSTVAARNGVGLVFSLMPTRYD